MRTKHLLQVVWMVALSTATIWFLSCTTDLDEACVGGPCTDPNSITANAETAAGGGPSCTDATDVGDYPCAVYAVLSAKCLTCHQDPPVKGAPMSLLTYEDSQKPYYSTDKQYWQQMQEYVSSGYMPFGSAPDLTDEEKQTLLTWFDNCAPPIPEGEGCNCDADIVECF